MNRFCFFAILVLLFFQSSCKQNKKADPSLSLKEYRELGVPDHRVVWNFQDYIKAHGVLSTLKLKEPFALPTKNSKRSSELFYRMISLENLSFLQEKSLPLNEKANRIKGFLGVYDDMIDLYINILMKNQYYNPELVEIWIFGLNVTERMVDLGEEINQSDTQADRRIASAFESIQMIYLTSLLKVLGDQQYTSQYPLEDLELLTDSISSSIQRNAAWIDDKEISEKIKQAMQVVVDSTSSPKIKNDYLDLINVL